MFVAAVMESSGTRCDDEAIGCCRGAEDDDTARRSATGACEILARSFREDRRCCRRMRARFSAREGSDGSFESPRSFIALDELPALPPWRGMGGGGEGGRRGAH